MILIASSHHLSLTCNFLDTYVLQISPFQDETFLSNPYNDRPVCLVVVCVQDGMPTHYLVLNPRHRFTMNGHISSHLYPINFNEIPHLVKIPCNPDCICLVGVILIASDLMVLFQLHVSGRCFLIAFVL